MISPVQSRPPFAPPADVVRRGFYIHALIYALVLAGLIALNLYLGKPYWVLWVLVGWGAGLALHAWLAHRY